jgi:hypothetical protein
VSRPAVSAPYGTQAESPLPPLAVSGTDHGCSASSNNQELPEFLRLSRRPNPIFFARYGDVGVSFPSHRLQLSSWRTKLLRRTALWPACFPPADAQTWLVWMRNNEQVRAPLLDGDTLPGPCRRDETDSRASTRSSMTTVDSCEFVRRKCDNEPLSFPTIFTRLIKSHLN